jgi:hypothetical protein
VWAVQAQIYAAYHCVCRLKISLNPARRGRGGEKEICRWKER